MVAPRGRDSRFQNDEFKAGYLEGSSEDSITAFAGGGQTSARQLVSQYNRLTTVATGADSVKLPPSKPGMDIVIINDGAAAAQVFGFGTDTIDGVATATGVAVTNAKRASFYCIVAGAWYSSRGDKTT